MSCIDIFTKNEQNTFIMLIYILYFTFIFIILQNIYNKQLFYVICKFIFYILTTLKLRCSINKTMSFSRESHVIFKL